MKHIFDFLDEYMAEHFQERAAILEFDAGHKRLDAERLAMEELQTIRNKVDRDKVQK